MASLNSTTLQWLPTKFSWQRSDLVATSLCILLVFFIRKSTSRKRFPPGPKRLPIIGSVLDMPKEKEWLKFTEWRETYGNIIHLSIFGRSIVVLNSAEDANELLSKRANIYSDRPTLTMAGELMGWEDSLVFSSDGAPHRQMRRLMQQSITPDSWPIQERATAKFLGSLLKSPERLYDHVRHTTGTIILKLAYGYDIVDNDKGKDPFVELAEIAVSEFSLASTAGAFLVDFMPWMKHIPAWVPGAKFQRIAAEWKKDTDRMVDIPFEFTKSQVAAGIAEPSLTSVNLAAAKTAEEQNILKWAAAGIYGGGADTTVASILSFFLCMCLNPEIQKRAQAEIDTVIGPDRLPTVADRSSLPYVEAVMIEVLRWAPVAPSGVPHRLSKDDNYNGYDLPKSSLVITNIWAMLRDPRYFTKPDEFRPERFLEEKRPDSPFADPLQVVFGFGRRICPGQRLAEPSIFLSIAMTLATFNIEKAIDKATGKTLEPVVDFMPGLIVAPKPFPCKITPRSSNAIELITRTAN
ncbi:hypothetical protein M422DRAFT_202062 [Sphaerobolus stellatus SS14]|nr:hypothetical protein M422DRAFT_202062 [Sphaerobolus stellatus SS14]